ncbi:hypothetical protein llg_10000 [Luteolibacter sp. LG18]|nr:hypothetical protein llg_10000 [Luteolibacter sp. LG18]
MDGTGHGATLAGGVAVAALEGLERRDESSALMGAFHQRAAERIGRAPFGGRAVEIFPIPADPDEVTEHPAGPDFSGI